jgi:pyrroloquinoline quinone biosynthesis protein D
MGSPMSSLGADSRPRLSSRARLQPDAPTGKLALLSPENVLLLNATGAAILELCDGRTVAEIAAALSQRYLTPPAQLETEVIAYLARLRDRGLLEISA